MRTLICLRSAALFVLALAPAPAEAQSLAITLRGGPAQPGGVVEATVESSLDLQDVTALLGTRSITFYRDVSARTWHGLIGIDVAAKPGPETVVIHATTSTGAAVRGSLALDVAPRRYATRRLSVAGRFVDPSPAELERIRDEQARMEALFAKVTPRRWEGPFALPVPGVTGGNFGTRSIFNGQPRAPHAGVDFRGSVGTPIAAPNAGRVVLAEELFFTGQTVIVDHGLGLYSLVAHLSHIDVTVGQPVVGGDRLGLLGATGRVTGPHLHWGIRLEGARVDPLRLVALLEAGGRPASPIHGTVR